MVPSFPRSSTFFVGLGVWSFVLVGAGFGPQLYDALRGTTYIPVAAHVHAAIMTAWLVVYTVQAGLVARGDLRRHRRLGWIGAGVAAAAWLSMAVATVTALRRFDPDRFGFLVLPLLIQLGSIVVFPIFVVWAIVLRRRTAWHMRLMAFATFAVLQAALDRMHWLPNEGLPMFWHSGLRAYVLLLAPLAAYDLVSSRRIHPATWLGSALLVAMHAVVSLYWTHEGWNRLARDWWLWIR